MAASPRAAKVGGGQVEIGQRHHLDPVEAIAAQVLEAILYGLDLDAIEDYPERINAVTADDIERVARTWLRPAGLSMVLVGDASVFLRDLPGEGFDRIEVVPLSELDLTAADFRRSADR